MIRPAPDRRACALSRAPRRYISPLAGRQARVPLWYGALEFLAGLAVLLLPVLFLLVLGAPELANP